MTKKRKGIYVGLLCISIFILYMVLYVGERNVLADGTMQINSRLLSFGQYFYMVLGLLALAFSLHLYTSMTSYQVGRTFTIYISCVAVMICLIAISNFRYTAINFTIGILSVVGNYILFYLTGHLILTNRKSIYRWINIVYITGTLIITVFYSVCFVINSVDFNDILGKYMFFEYAFTILILIVNLGVAYKGATRYSRVQIKMLFTGIVSGIFVLCVSHVLPLIAIVEIPKQNESIQEETMAGTETSMIYIENEIKNNIDAIVGVSGIIVIIIYILVQREYLVMEKNQNLKYYMGSVLYLIFANTIFRFFWAGNKTDYLVFNFLLLIALCLAGQCNLQKGEDLYHNHMLDILEDERSKISVYLHDEILQRLIAVSYLTKDCRAKEELTSVIGDIRNVSQNLYPTIAEDLGFEEALRVLIDEMNIDYNVEIEYQYHYPSGILPNGMALALYRMTKELITNAIKHSGSDYISVSISKANKGIQCIVADKGKGFQMPEDAQLLKSPHMGLYSVKKQVSEWSGSLQITSDNTGSRFRIYIPME
mgnify:FL=1